MVQSRRHRLPSRPRPGARLAALLAAVLAPAVPSQDPAPRPSVSGRYPHLAVFNSSPECGIGAIVFWAGSYWFVSYPPHATGGSDDGLYQLSERLELTRRPESVGGTVAGRLLHRRSGKLLIGRHVIDPLGVVRTISPEEMPGRITAIAEHLKLPLIRAYYLDMEGRIYDVDLRTLEAELLFEKPVPGWHGKGLWTGAGVVVLANNGEVAARRFETPPYVVGADPAGPEEAGVLAEWDGKTWQIIERKQFATVTGTGGVRGASGIPVIWGVGWDRRSVLLKSRESAHLKGVWTTWRLPKADFSYDGTHGWHTEWPRIRDVGIGPMLMNMHGGLFDLATRFGSRERDGIAPIGAYLKVISDAAQFDQGIVFACNDTSRFDNPLAGQAQSNLWFSDRDGLGRLGIARGWGSLAMGDPLVGGEPTDSYLFAGYTRRSVHLAHGEDRPVTFRFETQTKAGEDWRTIASVTVPPGAYRAHVFPDDAPGTWIAAVADGDVAAATVRFHYGAARGAVTDEALFAGLADIGAADGFTVGVVRPRGGGHGTLQVLAGTDGAAAGYYEMGPDLLLRARPDDAAARAEIEDVAAIPAPPFTVDAASVVLERDGARWRLPKGDPAFDRAPVARAIREVVTERSLLHAHGTFYVLPRDSSGGVRALMPVASHGKHIVDFCSWRGMLALTGVRHGAAADGHVFAADDGTAVWLGDVDDLWKLGPPRGVGGPWAGTAVTADAPSDPYLMTGYDRKTLRLAHDADVAVRFRIEVDVDLTGWHLYREVVVPPGVTVRHDFPDGYGAHWARLVAGRDCTATAQFEYR